VRRIAITASASGNGKTTLGREVARRLDVPFVELDAIAHGPSWAELPADELRARMAPIVAADAWVIDGTYRGKLGDLVLGSADVVVWLDLPIRVWLPRLVRRSIRRIVRNEELWHGNRETWRGAFGGRESLVGMAVRSHFSRRRRYPTLLAPFPVARLQTRQAVEDWLASIDEFRPVQASEGKRRKR
jgi:cytidylate kinase